VVAVWGCVAVDERQVIAIYLHKTKVRGRVPVIALLALSQTHVQKRSTISQLAADWHEMMIQRPLLHASEQLEQRRSNMVAGRTKSGWGPPNAGDPRVPNKIHCMTVLNFCVQCAIKFVLEHENFRVKIL